MGVVGVEMVEAAGWVEGLATAAAAPVLLLAPAMLVMVLAGPVMEPALPPMPPLLRLMPPLPLRLMPLPLTLPPLRNSEEPQFLTKDVCFGLRNRTSWLK